MINTIFLQTGGGGFDINSIVLFGGLIIIMYFFFFRPQQKKQKDQKKFIQEIKKGDQVVTIGGIHGKIFSVDDDTIVLEIEKGVKFKMEKSSISLEASKKEAEKSK